MKKLTMQEFADLFEMYVTKNEDGSVYAHEQKPYLLEKDGNRNKTMWISPYYAIFAPCFDFINDATTHDYRILVEPHTKLKRFLARLRKCLPHTKEEQE